MAHPEDCPNCHGTDRWWSTVDQTYFHCSWPQLTHAREHRDNDEIVRHDGNIVARCYKPESEMEWHIVWVNKKLPTKAGIDFDSCLKAIGMDIVAGRTSTRAKE